MTLSLAGTPLGNIGDASQNLIEAISQSTIVLAEDSRRFHRLCKDLNIDFQGRVISFFEGNESERIGEIETLLKNGEELLLLTDAGMPGVSDPGYRAVRVAVENDVAVKVIPGPSAVTTALLLSGLPCDRFCFDGFLPRTKSARINLFNELIQEKRTMIFFESPHRLQESVSDALSVFGADRRGAICREMTKTYEETIRGSLLELEQWCQSKEILGEITFLIAGASAAEKMSDDQILAAIDSAELAGLSRKDAIAEVMGESGWSKREIFDLLVARKKMVQGK